MKGGNCLAGNASTHVDNTRCKSSQRPVQAGDRLAKASVPAKDHLPSCAAVVAELVALVGHAAAHEAAPRPLMKPPHALQGWHTSPNS